MTQYLIDDHTIAKFNSHVLRGPDCWLWTGSRNVRNGYGQFGIKTIAGRWTMGRAHRVAYQLWVGALPEGLTVDHICHTEACFLGAQCPHRACVRPDHLVLVPQGVNVLRGNAPTAKNARKTHCVHGHALVEGNIYAWRGRRYCVECRRLTQARR